MTVTEIACTDDDRNKFSFKTKQRIIIMENWKLILVLNIWTIMQERLALYSCLLVEHSSHQNKNDVFRAHHIGDCVLLIYISLFV